LALAAPATARPANTAALANKVFKVIAVP